MPAAADAPAGAAPAKNTVRRDTLVDLEVRPAPASATARRSPPRRAVRSSAARREGESLLAGWPAPGAASAPALRRLRPAGCSHPRPPLRRSQHKVQAQWEIDKPYDADFPDDGTTGTEGEKWFQTFPYPYMNGRLHMGHAFSLTKCEYMIRFQVRRRCRAFRAALVCAPPPRAGFFWWPCL